MANLDNLVQCLTQSQEQATNSLVTGLWRLSVNTAKQSILLFSGKLGEQTVNEWFEKAEEVARAEGWTNQQKLQLFQDRLVKPALVYNNNMAPAQKNNYIVWKHNFKNDFTDITVTERHKNKLDTLKQEPDERVRDFVIRLNDLYKEVHGEGPATNMEPDVATLRKENKKKIFLNGLNREIYPLVWGRLDLNATWNKYT